MRVIQSATISRVVSHLCGKANQKLRPDVLRALRKALGVEKNSKARRILEAIILNAHIAARKGMAICQDTGMPVIFVKVGQNVKIHGSLEQAINRGVTAGYRRACLRQSIVKDPIARGRSGYGPAVIHTDIVAGDKLTITLLPKGFGCENKSQTRMFNPTAQWSDVQKFIIDAVKSAGPDACPPYVVGVGIGGTADYSGLLAKKALLKSLDAKTTSRERRLRDAINNLNIGPMGLGGKATCLGVRIETFPTHIAGLPVSVNISCHALRSAGAVL